MKTVVVGKLIHARRVRVDTMTENSVEFADLLDDVDPQTAADAVPAPAPEVSPAPVFDEPPIPFLDALPAPLLDPLPTPVLDELPAPLPDPLPAPVLDALPGLAELVMFRVPTRSGPEPDEPIVAEVDTVEVSRFATAGVDDDRLPVHAPRTRRRNR